MPLRSITRPRKTTERRMPKCRTQMAGSLGNEPLSIHLSERPLWVAMRLTSLRVRRRKVVVEVSLPGSSRSSPSADDPLLSLNFGQSRHSMWSRVGVQSALLTWHLSTRFGLNSARSCVSFSAMEGCQNMKE